MKTTINLSSDGSTDFQNLMKANQTLLQRQYNSTTSDVGQIVARSKDSFERMSELSKAACELAGETKKAPAAQKGFFKSLFSKLK